jgi:orotidine-5'-phosphate decarboxylase
MNKEESFRNSTCEDQINMAERELSAFIRAVTELFGPEQARLSAEGWLDESESMDRLARARWRDWRAVTVAASARLVTRGTEARDHRMFTVSPGMKGSPILSSNCFASAPLV